MPHHHIPCWSLLDCGVREVLARLQDGDTTLAREEQESVAALAWGAYTVTMDSEGLVHQFPWLTPEMAGQVVVLAKRVQQHTCGEHCQSEDQEAQQCKLYFPRLPSFLTQLALPPNFTKQKDRDAFLKPLEAVQGKVQQQLRELQRAGQLSTTSVSSLLHSVDQSSPKYNDNGGLSWAGLTVPPGPQLSYLLERCREVQELEEEEVLRAVCWQWCLTYRRYARVILARRLVEVYTASYSPAILLTTRTNHEVELITSTPGKVFNYITKGGLASSRWGIGAAVAELRSRGEEQRATEVEVMASSFKVRLVSLTEAIYRMTPSLSFSHSNVGLTHVVMEGRSEQEGDYEEEKEMDNLGEEDSDHGDSSHEDIGLQDEDYVYRFSKITHYSLNITHSS